MSRKARRITVALVLLCLAGGAVAVYLATRPPPQSGVLVIYGNVDIRQVELAFNDSDRIERVLVREGQQVRRGQLVARLETRRLVPAVEKARAQADAQRQVLARLVAGTRPEEIAQLRAQARAAAADATKAERNYQSIHNAWQQKAASRDELNNALGTWQAAQARQKAAEEALALALAGSRKEDIAAARAQLRADEAQLDLLQRQLQDANLCAPADGIVQDRILEPGDMASPIKPVLTLAITDPLWVRAYLSEADLGKVWPGMAATVSTDSFPHRRYEGWVGYISPTAEFTPKTVQTPDVRTSLVYQVRVYVHNPRNELRLGMPATVRIDLRQARPPGGAGASMPAEQP